MSIMAQRKYAVFFGAEILLLILTILCCIPKGKTVRLSPQEQQLTAGFYDEAAQRCYIDETAGYSGVFTVSREISLPAGSYEICLDYEADSADVNHLCNVQDDRISAKGIWKNSAILYKGQEKSKFIIWLFQKTDTLRIETVYNAVGAFSVRGISVRRTHDMERMLGTGVLFFVFLAHLLCAVREKYANDRAQLRRLFGLCLIVLVSSVALMTDNLLYSDDCFYHMLRIEGIRDGLLGGQFPVRMYPGWLNGHGYADSVLYGSLLLYVPGVLRLLGFPAMTAYKLFLLLINAATCLTAYVCFGRIFRNRDLGVLASLLYTLAPYRLYCMYQRGAVGEVSAMIFLPVLCYGFYRVFSEDPKGTDYGRCVLILVTGFTGIIETHMLTCEIAGGFTVLLCILLWKKVLQRNTFLVLAKTVVLTGLLNAWFLIPFLDYFRSGELKISRYTTLIQEKGLFWAHLFFGFPKAKADELTFAAATPGLPLLLGLAVFFLLWWSRTSGEEKHWMKVGKLLALFGVLSLVMTTNDFPWDAVQGLGRIPERLISGIQFPMRFLSVALPFCVMLVGVTVCLLMQERETLWRNAYVGALAAMSVLAAVYWQGDLLSVDRGYYVYDVAGMGTGFASGEEYLPADTKIWLLQYGNVNANNVEIREYEKEYLHVELSCKSGEGGYVELPMLCYRGYRAKDAGSGQPLQIEAGTNHVVRVLVPAGYEGRILVDFVGKWYWRAGEAVSLITLVAWLVVRKRKIPLPWRVQQ